MEGRVSDPRPGVLRTLDERFESLPGYDFEPHYIEIQGLRLHYVDKGPADAAPILLLHGEPSWSYLYRKMIPILVREGHRVIAPDLIGFGRSDKLPRKRDYSHQMHVDIMTEFTKRLDLQGITLFVQDWGGLIGLRVVAEVPDLFDRIAAGNTGLPDAAGIKGHIGPILFKLNVWAQGRPKLDGPWEEVSLIRWVAYSRTASEFPIGPIIQRATLTELQPDVLAAYEAPFPDDRYKAAARIMPSLIPTQLVENHRAWGKVLSKWEKPFLTTFSDSDPITRGGERVFQRRVPGARGQPHIKIKGAGHFLQEDKGEELAQVIHEFIERTR